MGFYSGGLPSSTSYDRYDDSPYYEPPAPWKILAEHDWAGDWEFSMLVVWRNEETGALKPLLDWLEPEDANAVLNLKAKVRTALAKGGRS